VTYSSPGAHTNSTQGRVHSLLEDEFGPRVVVDIDATAACPRCASGKGCGAALFMSTTRQIEMPCPPDIVLASGDIVEISLASDSLLRASLLVYALPMSTALAAVGLAYGLSLGDAAAATAALAGLFVGLAIARRRIAQRACLRQFTPAISRRLLSGEA
jgi:positive regulator of sigma E activity